MKLQTETRQSLCDTHGVYVSRSLTAFGEGPPTTVDPEHFGTPTAAPAPTVVWTQCPACITARRARDAAQAQRRAAETFRRRLSDAQIPPRFREASLDTYEPANDEQRRALAVCRRFVNGFEGVLAAGRPLALTGPPGTGKTHLAVGVLRAVLAAGRSGAYMTTGRAVRHVKASYGAEATYSEDEALEHLRMPDLLVLDELGNQHSTDDEKRVLFSIADSRYGFMRPTIWVSNLSAEALRAWAGDSFFDRLLEGGAIVPVTGGSYRPVKGRIGSK